MNQGIEGTPDGVIPTEPQTLIDGLRRAIEADPEGVLTWWEIARKFPYYTSEGVHSAQDDINHEYKAGNTPFIMLADRGNGTTLGFGLVSSEGDIEQGKLDLNARLSRKMKQLIEEELARDPNKYASFEVGTLAFQFPDIDTGPYPTVRAVMLEDSLGKRNVIYPGSEQQHRLMKTLTRTKGYIDPRVYESITGIKVKKFSAQKSKLNELLSPYVKGHGKWLRKIYPLGYAVDGETWRRNRLVRDTAMGYLSSIEQMPGLTQVKLLHVRGEYHIWVALVDAKKFFDAVEVPKIEYSSVYSPYLLFSFPHDSPLVASRTMMLELNESEASLVHDVFTDEMRVRLPEGDGPHNDVLRHHMNGIIQKAILNQYDVVPGIASRNTLQFPEIIVSSRHSKRTRTNRE